jgi:hypothetical protein
MIRPPDRKHKLIVTLQISLLHIILILPPYLPLFLHSRSSPWHCPGIYNLRDQLLSSIYPWLRHRCLAINNSSLLVCVDMSHVPVAWQLPGWNIRISSDISTLWPECHISPCLYSSLYLYNQIKEGN